MTTHSDRIIPIEIINTLNNLSVSCNALIDTGASTTCIPKRLIEKLGLNPIGIQILSTVTGESEVKQYFIGIKIKNKTYNVGVIGIDNMDIVLIGWDILSKDKIFPNLTGTIFKQTLSFLSVIPELKKNVVLILGQDTTEIYRLHKIRETLKSLDYEGIIVKEISDIDLQSVEEKVNMLASLSRFIICDNSVTSGHIDELKICSFNRFTTAIIQEENKGATWMQADYPIDSKIINIFKYSDVSKIPDVVKKAVEWAEMQLKYRTEMLNSLYSWRK